MPTAAKARVWRSTQTSPNATTIRDLTTAYGTTPNNTTVAAFAAAGASGLQWSPNTGATTANPPTAPAGVVTGRGWRDTLAENTAEQVTYEAGTWTIRARLNKTVMTVNASVTVRVTAIVFQVSTAGAWKDEIGRVVFADTALPTVGAPVAVSGSFTTGAGQVFAADDKFQVEVYVQNIVAGAAAAAVAAYTVALVTDETSANSGTGFTAIPTYTVELARSHAVTATSTPAMARQITAFRSFAVTAAVAMAATKRIVLLPKTVTAVATTAARKSVVPLPKTVTVLGVAANRKTVSPIPKAVTAVGTPAMARQLTAARAFTTTVAGVTGFVRAVILGRVFTLNASATPKVRLDVPEEALDRISVGGPTDYSGSSPTKTIAGVVRDNTGAPYAGATVKLIREYDGLVAATTTSAGDGTYSFTRDALDPNTYVVLAYEDSGTPTQGVSARGLVPV